jgi:uncharacterized protein YjiS (DUF1127 family)
MRTQILQALVCWWRVRREVARLSSYPDTMLKDIGISRSGIGWAVDHGRDAVGSLPKFCPRG